MPLYTVPLYKKLISYIWPVPVWKGGSDENPLLELSLYRGEYQLSTADALYSDGTRYTPMRIAFSALKNILNKVDNVLVLGAGLGSALQILDKKGFNPSYTIVDNDMVVLRWTVALLPGRIKERVKNVCEDANRFIEHEQQRYDMLIVDIFRGRVVPDFVTNTEFLEKCRNHINPGGHFVFNYIVNEPGEWQKTEALVKSIFTSVRVINHDVNRIVIAKV